VSVVVSPADNGDAASGTASFTRTYNPGTSVTLTAPAMAGSNPFSSWTGCTSTSSVICTVIIRADTRVTCNYSIHTLLTPTVTLTPSASTTAKSLTMTVGVSGVGSYPKATGSVTITSGASTPVTATLVNGGVQIIFPGGSLATGNDTFAVSYMPDAAGSSAYTAATGTSGAVLVTAPNTVSVNTTSLGPVVTDQILGMNMAVGYDPTNPAIVPAFQTAGIKALRWPGGSLSDVYHWAAHTVCAKTPLTPIVQNANSAFPTMVADLATPAGLDVALTADYGTDATCTGPGDPTEGAAWVAAALAGGLTVSHVTVGNEEYGSWEEDLHVVPHDPATYAGAVAGSTGYYNLIKAANSNTLVGVSVNPGNKPAWDPIVLAGAPYDFVEYHFYAEAHGYENDTFLVQQAAQQLTAEINTIHSELATAGHPNTPIYVGEISSVDFNPGKQAMSITQALFAGQALGEMMNDGVSRASWWIGFGRCEDADSGTGADFSSSLFGWQNFGGYMVFSDELPDGDDCENETLPTGILLPTARAFQLFSSVAVSGEHVLTATVAGDTTDVRAYAATHSGGTALVLFNLNETTSEAVTVEVPGQTAASNVSVETYSKAIYDLSQNNVWAPPTNTLLGAQALPLTLTLDPWSMNVVLIR
jgi:hypothetical protein